MEAYLMEKGTVAMSTVPVDLNGGANAGARISLAKARRCSFIIVAGAGTTPSSHTVSFQQHDAGTAGNSKALSHANPYWHKVSTATEFTKVVPGAAASSFDIDTIVGDTKFVAVFEVLAEDLDRNNDYNYVSCDVTDSGGAQLGAVVALLHEMDKPAYDKDVES